MSALWLVVTLVLTQGIPAQSPVAPRQMTAPAIAADCGNFAISNWDALCQIPGTISPADKPSDCGDFTLSNWADLCAGTGAPNPSPAPINNWWVH